MKEKLVWCLAAGFFAGATLLASVAGCEIKEIHGADSSFRIGDIGICWGMLRGAPRSDVQVVIRIRSLTDVEPPYSEYAVQAVHPFSRVTESAVPRRPLEKVNDVMAPREAFKNLTGRRILFYKPSASEPDLAVYYMGIPDTTPELTDAAQLEQYFDLAFKRLTRR
jgi:hypothetical protein